MDRTRPLPRGHRRSHRQSARVAGTTMTPSSNRAFFVGSRVIGGQAFYNDDDGGMREARADIGGAAEVNVWLLSCAPSATLTYCRAASDGIYRFTGLPPVEYFVIAQPPTGYQFSSHSMSQGNDPDGLRSTMDPNSERTTCFELEEGEKTIEWSFGLHWPTDVPSVQPSVDHD